MARNRAVAIGKSLASLFLLLCIAGLIAMRIHAERVRRKAEQLQAEVLKLTPGVTTLDEVRAFVSRTERPAGYAGFDGPKCDESECIVSVGPMAFLKGWRYPTFRRLGFLGIRPADYSAIVEVQGGVVSEVTTSTFYSTGPRRISSASVTLVEQFRNAGLGNTAAIEEQNGIALCNGVDRVNPVSAFTMPWLVLQRNSIRKEFHSICLASLPLANAPTSESFFIPKIRQHTAQSLRDLMRRAIQMGSGFIHKALKGKRLGK